MGGVDDFRCLLLLLFRFLGVCSIALDLRFLERLGDAVAGGGKQEEDEVKLVFRLFLLLLVLPPFAVLAFWARPCFSDGRPFVVIVPSF